MALEEKTLPTLKGFALRARFPRIGGPCWTTVAAAYRRHGGKRGLRYWRR